MKKVESTISLSKLDQGADLANIGTEVVESMVVQPLSLLLVSRGAIRFYKLNMNTISPLNQSCISPSADISID